MRIAVVQHLFRACSEDDLAPLADAVSRAAARGAEVVVIPEADALGADPDALAARLSAAAPGVEVVVPHGEHAEAGDVRAIRVASVGPVALILGDACIDPDALARAAGGRPALAILAPRSESDLQAEAALELAIGLSRSLAPVVLVVEPDGAELGEPGHGGSGIVHLEEVLAEAMAGEDVLVADIDVPVVTLGPHAPLPEVPLVLQQRLAAHRGRKLAVDYPADLD